MSSKFAALAAQAASIKDMTQAQTGGGDYTPPPAGPCTLRFFGYVEIGKHEKTYKGVPKVENTAILMFEVSGKNYPPTVVDGVSHPVRVSIELNLSMNDKATFFKLFTRMNHEGKAKHITQLLGEGYKGRIVHREYTRKDGKKGTAVELKDDSGFTIAPPYYDVIDQETGQPTGEVKRMTIPAAISEEKCFIWDLADMDQWASIFIDGEYPERKNDKGEVTAPAKSKNVLQNRIKLAKNFQGSPIHVLLSATGQSIDIPDAESGREPEAEAEAPAAQAKAPVLEGAAADDALANIV
jgi:hypothetical protein